MSAYLPAPCAPAKQLLGILNTCLALDFVIFFERVDQDDGLQMLDGRHPGRTTVSVGTH